MSTTLPIRMGYILMAVVIIVLCGHTAWSQPGPIDPQHYWTWSLLEPRFSADSAAVRDQFIHDYRMFNVFRLDRLLNPVEKTHDGLFPIRDPRLHYTWWAIQPRPRIHDAVVVFDQFYPGGFQTFVDSVAFILAPARKGPVDPPPDPLPLPGEANHYLCYQAHVPSPGISVGLRDQFRADPAVFVGAARYVCAPCWKKHLGTEYPPRDSTFLVVYEVNDPSEIRFPWILDQFFFGRQPVFQHPTEFLVVPARKLDVRTSVDEVPGESSTWGRVKQLYR